MPTLEPELLSRLLPAYVKARAEDLGKLRSAAESADFRLLERVAHKIKGSAGTFGFAETAETASKLEAAAREHARESCMSYIEEMSASLFKA